jgi:hypothetical protein
MNNIKLKHIFILFSLLIINSIKAQDLIITKEGDSLNCKITKIKANNIYFTFKYKEEIRSTLLPIGDVKYHQYNHYQTSIVPIDKIIDNKEKYPHFRVALNGGWSYRLAKLSNDIPSDFEEYSKDLKSGYNYGLDLSYYFSEHAGFGLKYSDFNSKNEIDIVSTYPDNSTQYGKMSDNISINFIGPFFSSRFLNANKKNSLIMNIGIGYLGYNNNAVLISDYKIKGSTVGFCWDIGYDIGLSENFALGFQFSYTAGTLTEYELSDASKIQTIKLDKNNYESLSRIDLSIGLRFNK